MPNVIEIRSIDFDEADREARRLVGIIVQEAADVAVRVAPIDKGFMDQHSPDEVPVFTINGFVVWEGSRPPRALVREWLNWPGTVGEAVDRVLQMVDEVPAEPEECGELIDTICEQFGLDSGNVDLLKSCGFDTFPPEVASEIILRRASEDQARRRRQLN